MQTEDKNNETKRGWSEWRNFLRKCFHSFKGVIDHANVRFFYYVNNLHCFMWLLSALVAATFLLRSKESFDWSKSLWRGILNENCVLKTTSRNLLVIQMFASNCLLFDCTRFAMKEIKEHIFSITAIVSLGFP